MLFRKLYSALKDHLQVKQISVLTGMRRTGKTTLVKALLDEIKSANKIYIDLERLDNRELWSEKNYENMVVALKAQGLKFIEPLTIALDEIQLVPNLPSVLKYLYDQYDIKFIVTGSSSFYLKNLFSESLAGRKKVFELYPLTFGEFLTFKSISYDQMAEPFAVSTFQKSEYERLKSYFEEYMMYGGFPEVVLSENVQQKNDLLSDILTSYILIDIKFLANFKDQQTIYTLIKLLAGRIANRLDVSKLSRLSGVARQTIEEYLNFFEYTYLLKRISVFSKSADRQVVKAQKLYFYDTGLARHLAELSSGMIFENTVFTQLHHFGEIQYYGSKSGQEIDFIIDKKAFEVKEHPLPTDFNKLENLCRKIKLTDYHLVGRYAVPKFDQFIWAGKIK